MTNTLTLDNDVAMMVNRSIGEMHLEMKEFVNSLLRSLLTARQQVEVQHHRFETPVFHGCRPLMPETTSTYDLLVAAEGENFKFLSIRRGNR